MRSATRKPAQRRPGPAAVHPRPPRRPASTSSPPPPAWRRSITPNWSSEFLRDHGFGDGVTAQTSGHRPAWTPDFFQKMDANGDGKVTAQELRDNMPQNSLPGLDDRDRREPASARRRRPAFGKRAPAAGIAPGNTGQRRLTGATGRRHRRIPRRDDPHRRRPDPQGQPRLPRRTWRTTPAAALLVFRNITPALTRGEMVERIREMRFQPDYANQLLHETDVLGLKRADGGEGFTRSPCWSAPPAGTRSTGRAAGASSPHRNWPARRTPSPARDHRGD